jgi:hypothetical protein
MTIHRISRQLARVVCLFAFALCLTPGYAMACACGCGVFDVGTASLFPSCKGGTAFLEFNYMDQDRNWSGTSSAPAADNNDKEIQTEFYTLGAHYMFNHSWGLMAQLPLDHRDFTTDGGAGVQTFHHTAFGDLMVTGVYTGLSKDMSTGLIFGLKLPTGDFRYPGFDRDTETGTGTVDSVLGAYHLGSLTKSADWTYFAQIKWQHALEYREGYRPGDEFDGAAGVYFEPGQTSDRLRLVPLLQLIASHRNRDSGSEADPDNSGYSRLLIAPGLEAKARAWTLYGDVEFPIYQRMNGDQLVAPALFKLVLSRSF